MPLHLPSWCGCKNRRFLLVCRASHWLHEVGHKAEHGLHLVYFAGLSTGFIDYHAIAALCLVAGLIALLPAGELPT